jgi:hypothetical protein
MRPGGGMAGRCALIVVGAVGAVLAWPAIGGAQDFAGAPSAHALTKNNPFAGTTYFHADGSWQSVRLPDVDLGLTHSTGLNSAGPVQSFKPRPDGYGVSGALGYVFPAGMSLGWVGANLRTEIGGSFSQVDDQQSRSGQLRGDSAWALLNAVPSFLCTDCPFAGTLKSDYRAWQAHVKGTSDYNVGGLTLSPSLTLFGGDTRVKQDFSQSTFNRPTGNGPVTDTYSALVRLHWADVGVKLGLDARAPAHGTVSIGLGGMVGFAHRSVTLDANDQLLNGQAAILGFSPRTSALNANATREVFLAGASTSVVVRPAPGVEATGFVGVNYDSDVPGIAAPSYASAASIPAGIKYSAEVSYHAGGRLNVAWAP